MQPGQGWTSAALVVCALSVSGAMFVIMELDQPFSGLTTVPSEPLRNALPPLKPSGAAGGILKPDAPGTSDPFASWLPRDGPPRHLVPPERNPRSPACHPWARAGLLHSSHWLKE